MANKKEALYADKQMHEIIKSLEKMKKAAELLSDAERDSSLIASTSKEIIQKISPFISSGEKILSSLDHYDVKSEIKTLENVIKNMNEKNELATENYQLKSDRLKDQITSARSKNTEQYKNILANNKSTTDNLKKVVSKLDKEMMGEVSAIKSLLTIVLFAVLGIGVCIWLLML